MSFSKRIILYLSFLLGTAVAWASPAFQNDCQALTAFPNRLSGSANYAAAAEHVLKRLQRMSPDALITQPFSSIQTETHSCQMVLQDGSRHSLLPMRPCGIMAPVTPPEGITGPLFRFGKGTPDDFNASNPEGTIALLNYNCGEGWLRALRMGAKAVVFTLEDPSSPENFHYAEANANLLRFFYQGTQDSLPPDGTPVTIQSAITWKATEGKNILAFFKGTAPVFNQEKEEVILLSAHLDTFGEVPELSPGARGAASCAALLQIADFLSTHRPKRHTLIAFFDNQARSHQGCGIFYKALDQDTTDIKIERRRISCDNETRFLEEMERVLALPSPLEATDSPILRQLLARLADKAQEQAQACKKQENALANFLQAPQEAKARSTVSIDTTATALPEADQLEAVLAAKHSWNDLQRFINQKIRSWKSEASQPLTADMQRDLDVILNEIRREHSANRRELEAEKRNLDADEQLAELFKDKWIVMHLSLMLGDTTPSWGLVIGGDSTIRSWTDNPGLYGKIQAGFLKMEKARHETGCPSLFLSASADQSIHQTRVLWAGPALHHSGEMAGLFGTFNLALATIQESAPKEGAPDDTLDNLNLDVIEAQAHDIARAFFPDPKNPDSLNHVVIGNSPNFSIKRGIVADATFFQPTFSDDFSFRGPTVMGILPGTSLPNTPVAGAVIQIQLPRMIYQTYTKAKHPAFDDFQLTSSNHNGIYPLGPIKKIYLDYKGFAAAFDKNGTVTDASSFFSAPTFHTRLNAFKANHGAIILPPQQQGEKIMKTPVDIFSGRTNSALDEEKSYRETSDGIVAWFSEEREKSVKLFGLRQFVGLNSGSACLEDSRTEHEATGNGFSMSSPSLSLASTQRSATDLWRLNDWRISLLSSRGILDASLAESQGRAEDQLREAASPKTSPYQREAISAIAFWSSRTAYTKVRSMLDDLVFALLILLALSVPFAFSMERVLIGATNIYKQLAWFSAFFLATFLILFFTHPAFAIANTPIIIFLGFAIVVMSAMVIFIIMRKFEVELKAMQEMATATHSSNVSSFSTFMAATQMGISTMRRRPARTALTAITILLLTFTILCFASFSTQSGIITFFTAPSPSYTGVYLHNSSWTSLNEELPPVIKSCLPSARLFQRYWISPTSSTSPGLPVSRPDASRLQAVRGLLGLEPAELAFRDDLKGLFNGLDDSCIMLTRPLADALHAKEGDRILLKGIPLTVGRLLDSVQLAAAKDLDSSCILPVDFTAATSASSNDASADEEKPEEVSLKSWSSLPVDQVVVTSASTAKRLGASLHGLQLYTSDSSEAIATAETLTHFISGPIPATRDNGVYRHIRGTVLKASGLKDLFFPVLLGGLVIFGTMLGSAADRKKEIYTFSALGLAPKHVATLFFAEASVYALIGGMGGYLLAQAILKALGFAASYGLVRVPEMNMSSTNTIFAILIVMATVLLSSVYPAIVASRSANPGLMRAWHPPMPVGDTLELVFPFTISQYDLTGILSFLFEYFESHSDTGLGEFMAEDTVLEKKEGMLTLRAILSLPPFDLGVSQDFALSPAPSEIEGIDEVRIIMKRRSGQPRDWQRLNKVFLDALRQQFLLWRSLPRETMEHYRQRTLNTLEKRDQFDALSHEVQTR